MRTLLVTLVLAAATFTSAPALAQEKSQNDNGSLMGRPATHGNGMAVEFDSTGSIIAINCPGVTWGEVGEPTQHIASKRLAALMAASGQNGVDCGIAIQEIALATAQADAIRMRAEAKAWALKVRTGAGAAMADDVPTYLSDDVLATGNGPAQLAALSGMYQNGNMPFNPAWGLQGVANNYAAWTPGALVAPVQPQPAATPTTPTAKPATAAPDPNVSAAKDAEIARLRAQLDDQGAKDAAEMFPER